MKINIWSVGGQTHRTKNAGEVMREYKNADPWLVCGCRIGLTHGGGQFHVGSTENKAVDTCYCIMYEGGRRGRGGSSLSKYIFLRDCRVCFARGSPSTGRWGRTDANGFGRNGNNIYKD